MITLSLTFIELFLTRDCILKNLILFMLYCLAQIMGSTCKILSSLTHSRHGAPGYTMYPNAARLE